MRRLMALLEPVLILTMALVVAFFIVSLTVAHIEPLRDPILTALLISG